MAFLSALLVIVGSMVCAATPSGEGPSYNCSKVTTQDACVATGWCVWLGTICYYDQCLKPVAADADYDTACDLTGPNGAGSKCNLYYLTDAHNCDTGVETQVDLYCRENGTSFVHNVIDSCFYNDMKAKAADGTGKLCGDKWCKENNGDGGFYCDLDPEEQDCTPLLPGKPADFCACLGVKWCGLYPKCILTGSGSNQACDVDPCARGNATGAQACTSVGNAVNCEGRQEQFYNTATEEIDQRWVCATKSNNDPNQCFFVQKTTGTTKYPEYPECTVYSSDSAVCESGFAYDNSKNTPKTDTCKLVSLPGGYFTGNSYCTDGRETPSVGAASFVNVPFFVSLVVVFASLFL